MSDKSDGRDLLYRLGFVVSGEDCASEGKDLLSLTLSPSRQVALNSARSTAVQSHSQSGNGEASSSSSLKGRKKVDKSALPALLRSKINGRPSVIRLLRKRHFRSYNRLLYDFPRKGSAGHEDDQLQVSRTDSSVRTDTSQYFKSRLSPPERNCWQWSELCCD